MPTRRLSPRLAEMTLAGATDHALSVRVAAGAVQIDIESRARFRAMLGAGELALSLTAYAAGLIRWAATDTDARLSLLSAARSMLIAGAETFPPEAGNAHRYRAYTDALRHVAIAATDVAAIAVITMTVNLDRAADDTQVVDIADATVRTILLAGRDYFGDPRDSAERMRNTMTALAYADPA